MTPVHPAAEKGFSRAAAEYERARPDYPAAAVEHLLRRLRLGPGRTVVDLAAGTGKLTRPLVAAGCEVIAVEPVAEMRAALPESVRALDGTAESIPLSAAAADAVTVAQAFHWFAGETALAEIHRVLRPGGALALVWNRRVDDEPVNQAIDALLEPHRLGTPTHRTDAWRAEFEGTRLFGPLEESSFANEQTLDAEGMADRVGSISFVASLPPAERAQVLDAARALAASGPVAVPYRTEVQVCERLG
jgi:ubiquinone/menaquinone biosynthesis C-methylase UbiE